MVLITEKAATAASPPAFSRIRLTAKIITTDAAIPVNDGTPPDTSSLIFRHCIRFTENENTHFFDRKYPAPMNTAT